MSRDKNGRLTISAASATIITAIVGLAVYVCTIAMSYATETQKIRQMRDDIDKLSLKDVSHDTAIVEIGKGIEKMSADLVWIKEAIKQGGRKW